MAVAMSASSGSTPGPVISFAEFDRLRNLGARIVVADVRWYLDGRDGRAAFEAGHVPGAVFVDIDHHLAGHREPTDGRHPLPTPDDFARSMSEVGIGNDTWVVAYDDTGGMTAGRLVVMLRMLGCAASLLDGGYGAWLAAHPDDVEKGPTRVDSTARFTPVSWPNDRLASIDKVRSAAHSRSVLIDARSAERFRGDSNPVDTRFGHIPGAYNAPWSDVLDGGRLRSIPELRRHYSALCVDDADEVIAYCGSGVSACLNVLAMEHAGFAPPKLFVASWSGWSADPNNDAETGPVTPDHHRHRDPRTAHRASFRALVELRRTRQRRRLAEVEWFEALYRVYLAAFMYGGGILFVSDLVAGDPASSNFVIDVEQFGPGWLGLAAVLAITFGLRSGSRGGPLALEEADVRHALLAPIDRARALRRPAVQRMRTIVFAATAIGAFAGQLAGRRFPGSEIAWAAGGALWGLGAGSLFVATAFIAHAMRLRQSIATVIGFGLVGWQAGTAPTKAFGPADSIGGLALWGERTRPIELIGLVVALALLIVGVATIGRQSLEALSRRSALVTQLRFAVTMQDLRTVMLLRRQLAHEQSRRRPWLRLSRNGRGSAEWRRTIHGIARYPLTRVLRIAMLSATSGAAAAAVIDGSTPLVVASGLLSFIVGLELLEPLAQEIDHGERTDSLPVERGPSYLKLTYASVAASVPCAAVFAVTASILTPDHTMIVLTAVIPAVLAGLAGAAINIVSGAPDPLTSTAQNNLMPPEVAGTMSVLKAIWPVALATVGQVPFAFAGHAIENGNGPEAAALRASIAIVLMVGLVAAWIHRRDAISAWIANAAKESRQPQQSRAQ
ncbi:MAG: sulfurtransferase [Actinobacteria bacterium]|nr:sulfurtransferase [Actinomycetota bacterium]